AGRIGAMRIASLRTSRKARVALVNASSTMCGRLLPLAQVLPAALPHRYSALQERDYLYVSPKSAPRPALAFPDRCRTRRRAAAQLQQLRDAVARIRVRREQIVGAIARQRVDDEEMRHGRIALGVFIETLTRTVFDALQSARQGVRVAAD